MNKRQENYISMCGAVDTTCKEEAVVVSSLAALQDCHNDLISNIARVKEYMAVQGSNIKGWTKKKKQARLDMIKKTLKLMNGATGYALVIKDFVLFGELNFSMRNLVRRRDEEIDVFCEMVNTKCSGIAAMLGDYGVTVTDVTTQAAAVVEYRKVKQKPNEKEDEKQVATEGIARTIKKIRGVFKIMDKVVRTMEDSEPEFVKRYFNSREVYDL